MFEQMTGGRLQFAEPDDVRLLEDEHSVDLAGLTFGVRHAPGTHPDPRCSWTDAQGDIRRSCIPVTCCSPVRSDALDLPGGDTAQMMRSLSSVVLPQPRRWWCSRPREQTTIGQELTGNLFWNRPALLNLQQPPGVACEPAAAPRGVPEYPPGVSADFLAVRNTLGRAAELGGYGYIELPVFEDTAVFVSRVGDPPMS